LRPAIETITPIRRRSAALAPEDSLAARFTTVRRTTEALIAPLTAEDCALQSMSDCSPTKWHLAHTSWFFETFILAPNLPGYRFFNPAFRVLFNSYYQTVGEQYARPRRALLTRPSLEEVLYYRRHVDEQMGVLLEHSASLPDALTASIVLGLNHEQQHQELILTDIKHLFSFNPTHPIYHAQSNVPARPFVPLRWCPYSGGLVTIGHDDNHFAFDNEGPLHKVYLQPFELSSRTVTNGEFLAFIEAGGYQRPEFWLSDGWNKIRTDGWHQPLYWEKSDGAWSQHTLNGFLPLDLNEPVCHVSHYEADAYARFASARLPTEAEWEHAASQLETRGNFIENGRVHPEAVPANQGNKLPQQMFGDTWEWTASAYLPYPGFKTSAGALGEYNGKFMSNQMVLRGGSCATPQSHIRASYRNFFPADARWQFSGIRLARDA
jgi:ergothioneine biosynthesis protein EgtB